MSILRWTSPARALRQLKRGRPAIRMSVRDQVRAMEWIGHIGKDGVTEPSCGCPACTSARFNMKVK